MADVTVEIGLELKEVNKKLDQLSKNVGKGGKEASANFGKVFTAGVGKIFAGNVLASLVAGGITAAFKGLSDVITGTFSNAIEAAKEQEDAINSLNNALRTAGDFSEAASKDFQEFASSLQQATRFGDELLLNQLALAKSFGASNEQAKQIVAAATDLSAAFGIDLESATRNVAKTLGGFAGELGEVIPELKNLDQAALQSGEGIELLARRFSGAAARDVGTFSGALQQAQNSFGDFLEQVGGIITNSPLITKSLNELSKIFNSLGLRVQDFANSFSIFDDVIDPLINFGNLLIVNLVRPFEIAGNVTVRIGNAIGKFFSDLAEDLIKFLRPAIEAAEKVARFIGKELGDSFDLAKEKFTTFARESNETGLFAGVLDDTSFSDGLLTKLDQFKQFNDDLKIELSKTNETFGELSNNTLANISTTQDTSLDELRKAQAEYEKEVARFSGNVSRIINGGLAKGISGGIQNIVNSLAKGEDVFANFGKFLLTTIGDLAIQLGTFFIAEGIATQALLAINPPSATIAAGAGLVALGAILKSFAGSGGSGSAGGSSVTGTGGSATDAGISSGIGDPDTLAEFEEQQTVTINVEGSIVQQQELGEFISATLNDVKDQRGAVLT